MNILLIIQIVLAMVQLACFIIQLILTIKVYMTKTELDKIVRDMNIQVREFKAKAIEVKDKIGFVQSYRKNIGESRD